MPKRISAADVTRAIARAGIDAELVRGRGYWYFVGPGVEHADSTMVYVCYLSELTLDRWIEEAKGFAAESATRIIERGIA